MATFAEHLNEATVDCLDWIVSNGISGRAIDDVIVDATFDFGPASRPDGVVLDWLTELMHDNLGAIVSHPVDAEEAKEVMGDDSFVSVMRYTLHEVFQKQLGFKVAEHAGVV